MIIYQDHLQGITESSVAPGFFDGWPNPPSPAVLIRLLANSTFIILAIDADTKRMIGFMNCLSDKVLTAYIPLLEVIPEYQGRGIGKELTARMLERLKGLYMVDLLCDPDVQEFYARLGMKKATGMLMRNYEHQSGAEQ